MANKFKLQIISPDGKKINDEAEILNVVTSGGALGIMARHLPLVAVLTISHMNYKKDGMVYEFSISVGILNLTKEGTIVLAESFESKEEIDIERANKSKLRAEKRLESKDPNIDFKRAEISLKRALNRLSL